MTQSPFVPFTAVLILLRRLRAHSVILGRRRPISVAEGQGIRDLETLRDADADHVQRPLAGEAEILGHIGSNRLAAIEGDETRAAVGPCHQHLSLARAAVSHFYPATLHGLSDMARARDFAEIGRAHV